MDDNGVTYETLNNRLMYYEVYENMTLLERRDYEYDNRGNAMYIVRKLESEPVYHGYTLQYNNQNEVWFVTEQTWTLDEFGFCEDPQTQGITEFRGNGRQRYMVRQRDPSPWMEKTVLPGTTRWSDYDGDEIYGDYIVDDVTGVLTETMAYLPGVAQMDSQTGEIVYFHGDQIGSARAICDQQSAVSGTMVYTAFGEKVYADGAVGTRYQYAGAWGYESSARPDALADLGWLHVGHRYYDPATGRFLQRDPIGLHGGPNAYEYIASSPLLAVDPNGEIIWILVIIGAGLIVLDGNPQYANAPGPDDLIYGGGGGPSGAAFIGGLCVAAGVGGGAGAGAGVGAGGGGGGGPPSPDELDPYVPDKPLGPGIERHPNTGTYPLKPENGPDPYPPFRWDPREGKELPPDYWPDI